MQGKRIGQYEILEELGKGGMASVYRAFQPSMERYVAIKIIHQNLAQDSAGKERFRQEARLIARLEHPHLLPVHDYSPDNAPPYIVMRYLEGGTLKEVMDAKKTIPLHEIAYLLRQLASALDYAHRNGVVHRDIKPSNIMIDGDGNAYLADFGIARIVGQMGITKTGFAVGTPGYMSPEQGMGISDVSGAADVYALGVLVFEMATGQAPYRGETPMAVLMQHIQNPIPSAYALNPDLPEAIDAILTKALAKEAQERYQKVGEFSADIAALLAKSDLQRSPEQIKTLALATIKENQLQRDEKKINQLLLEFEKTRSAGMKAAKASKGNPESSRPDRLSLTISLVLILILLSVLAFLNRDAFLALNPVRQSTNLPPVEATLNAVMNMETASSAPTQTFVAEMALTNVAIGTNAAIESEVAVRLATQITYTPSLTSSPDTANRPSPSALLVFAQTDTDTPRLTASHTPSATYTSTDRPSPTASDAPSPTANPTVTDTPSATTANPLALPTASNNREAYITALNLASNPMNSNAAWESLYPTGFVWDFGDGVEMVLVPAGCFQMGNDTLSYNVYSLGVPDGGQQCFEPFWIDQTEVIQGDFARLEGEAASASTYSGNNRPVENINFYEARSFCEERRGGFLATEAEWEYAARGVDELFYPWGNEYNQVNLSEAQSGSYPVGTYTAAASWVGALDLSGNVYEWTSTIYYAYPYVENDGREDRSTRADPRIIRGGSWLYFGERGSRVTERRVADPFTRSYDRGFRCIRPLE